MAAKPTTHQMTLCVAAITLAAFAYTGPVTAAESPLQQLPLTLQAADVVPRALRSGAGYSIDAKVFNDGFQNTYTLKSDYGIYAVTGNGALAARIQEIQATRMLDEIESSDAFKDAVKGTASGVVEGGKALVSAPVDTTKGAVKGVGRWLGNVGRSVSSKDPHQENVLKVALGHDAVKRGYAIEMGVDPNTDFAPFQERLGRVARAATGGGLLMSMVTEAATEGTAVGTVVEVTSMAGMKDILMDEPPSTLSRINRDKLEKMGIEKISIDALLKNYNYTPTEMTIMVESLRRMGNIKGRNIFVAYATAAPDRLIVEYVQQSAEMLANYIEQFESGNIISINDDAWFVTRSGTLVGAFPIDYLAWTAEIDGAEKLVSASAGKHGFKAKELLLEGLIDPLARKAFEARGWKVRENVQLASELVEKSGGRGATPVGAATKVL